MVIFGGRGIDPQPKSDLPHPQESKKREYFNFNDTWSLIVTTAVGGKFVWKKEECQFVKGRYQHSSLFIDSEMVVLGGINPRHNPLTPNVELNVYNTSISKWTQLSDELYRFRQTCWFSGGDIFVHGGQQHKTNKPYGNILKASSTKLFKDQEVVQDEKLKYKITGDKNFKLLDEAVIANGNPNQSNGTVEMLLSVNKLDFEDGRRRIIFNGSIMNQGTAKQSSEYNSIYERIINTLVPKEQDFNKVVASSNFYDQY